MTLYTLKTRFEFIHKRLGKNTRARPLTGLVPRFLTQHDSIKSEIELDQQDYNPGVYHPVVEV